MFIYSYIIQYKYVRFIHNTHAEIHIKVVGYSIFRYYLDIIIVFYNWGTKDVRSRSNKL